jgi:hypothetical protein
VVPLRCIEAHLGDRRYSSYSFFTSALEGGEWSASRPGRALPPGKEPPIPTVQEAGWAPEPVWTQRGEEKSSASVGDRTPAAQSVVRHCTELPGWSLNKTNLTKLWRWLSSGSTRRTVRRCFTKSNCCQIQTSVYETTASELTASFSARYQKLQQRIRVFTSCYPYH